MPSTLPSLTPNSSELLQEGERTSLLEVRESRIDGCGLFASVALPARRKLGEFTGERISYREARKRVRGQRCIFIIETNDGFAVDGAVGGNLFCYLNHSCMPNAYIRICRGRIEFYTLRAIAPGEELTCDYGETHHEGALPCRCGSPRCRGRL